MAAEKVTKAAPTAPNADKKRAIETAMAQIEKLYGKGSIMRCGDEQAANVEAISTGSPARCRAHREYAERSTSGEA